ncbi:MAG TPA: MBL fold metallo-hydrolase [Arenicellales bacterium]|nr:MBL fold metallo-hydrolase [Arenicellales bacterium]
MRITLLGTGCPIVDSERLGPAALVRSRDAAILVDCGSGVTQRLASAACPGRDIDAVLLTHLHTDHLVDLYQLIVSSWHQGRKGPQRIYGPPGTQAHVDGLMDLWRREREGRIAHERRPNIDGLQVQVEEIEDGTALQIGDVLVKAVEVDHKPVPHAFGFVFENEGDKAVISGDTTYCPALIGAARDADLLVHEVFMHHEMPEVPGVRTREVVENVASYHTLSSVVGKVAEECNAACLVLTHFVPTRFDRARLLAEVRADYAGPLVIGEDLMTFDTADRSLEFRGALLTLGS